MRDAARAQDGAGVISWRTIGQLWYNYSYGITSAQTRSPAQTLCDLPRLSRTRTACMGQGAERWALRCAQAPAQPGNAATPPAAPGKDAVSTQGFIYAIKALGTKYVKIGSAVDPMGQRLKQLQTGTPFELELAAWIPVDAELLRVEKALHRALTPAHFRGEWFEIELSTLDLAELVRQAVEDVQRQGPKKETKEYCTIHIDVPPESKAWVKNQPESASTLIENLLREEYLRVEGVPFPARHA